MDEILKDYSREAAVLTEDVIAFARQCLDEDAHNPRKQHHTAKRIYDRLVARCSFTGGETTVTAGPGTPEEASGCLCAFGISSRRCHADRLGRGDCLSEWRQDRSQSLLCPALLQRRSHGAGLRRQNEESFLDALVQVFQYFSGVPRRVIFDNGKVAVKDGFGAHARKQARYAALAAHYGFEAVFCNPASGNEKGLVEGLVGYSRRNTCVPVPRVDTMEELNQMFREKCQKY